MKKALTGLLAFAVWWTPSVASAQLEPIEPNISWVFWLSILIAAGLLFFLAFLALYYLLAVVARNRKFAAPEAIQTRATAPAASPAPAPQAPASQAAPAAAQAPAPAPAQAPSSQSPAPAEAPAPAAAAPAQDTGGIPRIDPNNLPDGIDAVTRGRLKKLSVLQDRGQEPPAQLLEELKDVLPKVQGAPAAQPAAPAAPAAEPEAPASEEAPAQAEEAPATEPAPSQEAAPAPAPAAATGDLPAIDPNNLPDGIDAVTRGRLKKLAVFQERGQAPPADLVEKLKPVLEQISS